ncbi:MAG: MMPL family transporter [Mariprofundaceae bacterium]|nr:MMPL family transporter [Mariprofundaceae bacterium]
MKQFTAWVIRWPKLTIATITFITLLLTSQMQHMKIDTDTESFIPPGHEATLNNDRMKEIFGTPDLLWIGVIRESGGIYQSDTLRLIQSLTEQIRLVPGIVDQDVVSLSTEDNIYGTADGMEVEPFMERVPVDRAGLKKLEFALKAFDIYDGFIVARDGSAAAILAELEPQELLLGRGLDKFAVYRSVKSLVDEASKSGSEQFYVAGVPVAEATLGLYIQEDMGVMLPLVFLVLMLLLFFTYRSIRGVVIPMLVVTLSTVAALGIMAGTGVPMYPTGTMIPVVLMAIGVADAIHILGKYYELVLIRPDRGRDELVSETMAEMWQPVVLTSLTTAAGFLSFLMMGMVPLEMMGLFIAIGILYAMLVSLTLVPALLCLLPVRASKKLMQSTKESGLQNAGVVALSLALVGHWVCRNHEKTLLLTSALMFIAAAGASLVYVQDAYIANFQQDSEIVKADHEINRRFVGSYQRNILLDAKSADAFYDPKLLESVWAFQQGMESVSGVGGSISIADFIRRMHRVMNEEREEMAKIPDSPDLIAQYLLLYSFSGAPDDFAEVIDSEYRQANIRIFCTSDNFIDGTHVEAEINRLAHHYFDPIGVQWSIAGNAHVGHVQTEMITDNLRYNIMMTIFTIFLFAWAMMRSLVAGLFVMVPVLAAVILNFAIMGVAGVTIGWGSSMFTSVAICIGVDYAIHLLYKVRHEFERLRDIREALPLSLATTGKTIFFNAVVVVAGFMVLLASQMPPNQQMGLLVSAAMLSSFIATLTVLPALIMTAQPKFIFKVDSRGESL